MSMLKCEWNYVFIIYLMKIDSWNIKLFIKCKVYDYFNKNLMQKSKNAWILIENTN